MLSREELMNYHKNSTLEERQEQANLDLVRDTLITVDCLIEEATRMKSKLELAERIYLKGKAYPSLGLNSPGRYKELQDTQQEVHEYLEKRKWFE